MTIGTHAPTADAAFAGGRARPRHPPRGRHGGWGGVGGGSYGRVPIPAARSCCRRTGRLPFAPSVARLAAVLGRLQRAAPLATVNRRSTRGGVGETGVAPSPPTHLFNSLLPSHADSAGAGPGGADEGNLGGTLTANPNRVDHSTRLVWSPKANTPAPAASSIGPHGRLDCRSCPWAYPHLQPRRHPARAARLHGTRVLHVAHRFRLFRVHKRPPHQPPKPTTTASSHEQQTTATLP